MANYSIFHELVSLELFDYGNVVLVWTYENFHGMIFHFDVLILQVEESNFHTKLLDNQNNPPEVTSEKFLQNELILGHLNTSFM